MPIPSKAEYEANEARRFQRDLADVEHAPLDDRKQGAAGFLAAMKEYPEMIGERIAWLLNGSYGYGSYKAAWRVINSPRMNRAAWLNNTIASLEWKSPQKLTAAAWHSLTAAEQKKVTAAIAKEIKYAETELKSQGHG